jgi:hypothetical protein
MRSWHHYYQRAAFNVGAGHAGARTRVFRTREKIIAGMARSYIRQVAQESQLPVERAAQHGLAQMHVEGAMFQEGERSRSLYRSALSSDLARVYRA